MTLLVIIIHLLIDCLFGLSVLSILGEDRLRLFSIVKAGAIGMFADTLLLATLSFVGLSLQMGFILFGILSISCFALSYKKQIKGWIWDDPLFQGRLNFWEIVMLGVIAEKMIWSVINLSRLPLYFDDALNHWSGRGKALLYGVNWSWDPESVYFMGDLFGHEEYPLFLSIWRATNTTFLGQANGASERADSLIMAIFVLVTVLLWIQEKSGKRWLGLAGAMTIAALPLQAWHMTAGYAEIFIQSYLVLAFWSLFNRKYILAGIFAAALIWSKNEGLVLFMPSLALSLGIVLLSDQTLSFIDKIKKFSIFNLTWLLTISPWIVFKLALGVGFTTPTNQKIGYVDGALTKMAEALFTAPSSGIIWIFLFLAIILNALKIIRDKDFLALTIGSFIVLLMMTFVFTSTGAYIFLENQMTIHRSLLQITPAFVVLVALILGSSNPKTSLEVE